MEGEPAVKEERGRRKRSSGKNSPFEEDRAAKEEGAAQEEKEHRQRSVGGASHARRESPGYTPEDSGAQSEGIGHHQHGAVPIGCRPGDL